MTGHGAVDHPRRHRLRAFAGTGRALIAMPRRVSRWGAPPASLAPRPVAQDKHTNDPHRHIWSRGRTSLLLR